jgi:prepilin-type N-terminal cleavage/methylation domain-containing protein
LDTRPNSSRPDDCRTRRGRRGFTLVELVLAASLSAIVLLGLQSAVMIAAKAIPPSAILADFPAQGAALDRMALDLTYAKQITQADATGITITVADRNQDAGDDSIQFSWSGVAGAPLVRTFNGASEVLLSDVRAFTLDLQTEVVMGAPIYQESSESLLAIHNSVSNQAPAIIDDALWAAQSVPITLPADAIDFRTTRVRLYMMNSGAATGSTAVELRSLRSETPTSRTLSRATIAESTLLGSPTWVTFPLVSEQYFERGDRVGLVVRPAGIPPSCQVMYRSMGANASTGTWHTSTNGGGSWTSAAGCGMLYEVWGVYRVLGTVTTTRRGTFILMRVRAGSNEVFEMNLTLPSRPVIVS